MHPRRPHHSIAYLLALLLLLSACTVPSPSTQLPADADAPSVDMPAVVRLPKGGEPDTLDPALVYWAADVSLVSSMFMTLTEIDLETQQARPFLAERWESNEERTEWTFFLRQDVPWVSYNADTDEVELAVDDDGAPRLVMAHDVVYGSKRLLDPRTAAPLAFILYGVVGALEANTSDPDAADFAEMMDGIGIEALDDWTIRFTLSGPASYWPLVVSSTAFAQPAWAIESAGEGWIEDDTIVTNSAYTLQRWLHDNSVEMTRNPHWPLWGDDIAQGNVDKIEWVIIEPTAALPMYEQDELDSTAMPVQEIERVQADEELSGQLVETTTNCNNYLLFQTQKAPTDNPNVRRALSMAIDRRALLEDILHVSDIPANTMTPPGNAGTAALDLEIAPWALTEAQGGLGHERAVELGRQVLADAGYPNGAGLSFSYLTVPNASFIGQALQAMWQTAYPEIEVTLEVLEPQAAMQLMQPDTPLAEVPNTYLNGWCADYPHANNYLYERFHSVAGQNEPRLSVDDPMAGEFVAEFDALTAQAQTAADEDVASLYKAAEQLLVEDIAAIAPLSYGTAMFLTKPWLTRVHHEYRMYLYQWELDVQARATP